MDKDVLKVYIDFKSAYSFTALPAVRTISRDYYCDVEILPFLTSKPKWPNSVLTDNDLVHSRAQKMSIYKRMDAKRYAALLGFDILDAGYEIETTTTLCGILWINQHNPSAIFEYCEKIFRIFWLNESKAGEGIAFEDMTFGVDFVVNILESMGIQSNGFSQYVHELGKTGFAVLRPKSVLGVPGFQLKSSSDMYFSQQSLSFIRYNLQQRLLQRSSDITPDITVAFRYPLESCRISHNVYGMPGTGFDRKRLQRYKHRSKTSEYAVLKKKNIDVYIDIKSPHAYLAVEMSMALEEDFDVNVNFLPYHLPISDIYGTATKSSSKEKNHRAKATTASTNSNRLRKKRTSNQFKIVKYGYRICRELAEFQNTTVMGTTKVYDSRQIMIAMLWAKKCGRLYMDSFLEYTFPIMWRRMLDVEDLEAVKECVSNSGVPLSIPEYGSFDKYLSGDGFNELNSIMQVAERKGVLGVPSYVFDDQIYFGKEHLSLIRLELTKQGLNLNANCMVDVPYLWRPMYDERKVSNGSMSRI